MTNDNKDQKVILVDYEENTSLASAAIFLETIATKLKEDKSFILTHNGQTHQITPSQNVELEVKLEEKSGKFEFEIELEWIDGNDTNNELHID